MMSAKVESPRILIRSIGSIWTATLRLIGRPRFLEHTFDRCGTCSARSRAGVEGGGDVAWDFSRRDQDRVETDVANARIGVLREPGLGGRDDPRPLPLCD